MSSSEIFDCFLSYNSRDTAAALSLTTKLRERGISVWTEKDQLRPGVPWQDVLEKGILASTSTAVLLGASRLESWDREKMRVAVSLAVKEQKIVIPVLLPDAPAEPDLPLFLRQRTWVDLRSDDPSALENLVWGITGHRPDRTDLGSFPALPYNGRSLDGWLPRRFEDWQADGDGLLTLGLAPRCFPLAPTGLQEASLIIWRGLEFTSGWIESSIWIPLLAEGGAAGLVLSWDHQARGYAACLRCAGRGSIVGLELLSIDHHRVSSLRDLVPIVSTTNAECQALSFLRQGRRLTVRIGDTSVSSDSAEASGGNAGLIRFTHVMARFTRIRIAAK